MMMIPDTYLVVGVYDYEVNRSVGWCFMMMVPEADLLICVYDDDSQSRSVGLC